jgi:2-C-methyl-D-erythritol 4-phosphate cytidylyltransferase
VPCAIAPRSWYDHASRPSMQATDDVSLVRNVGGLPFAITHGSHENINRTTAEDLVYAAAMLQIRVSASR